MGAQRLLAIAIITSALYGGSAAEPMDESMDEAHHAMELGPLGIEDTRSTSGTAWQPDSTPMFMWHARSGDWRFGVHTNSFLGYDGQASARGDDQFLSINWLMGMAMHPAGTGDLMSISASRTRCPRACR
jgi:hypothetical protein